MHLIDWSPYFDKITVIEVGLKAAKLVSRLSVNPLYRTKYAVVCRAPRSAETSRVLIDRAPEKSPNLDLIAFENFQESVQAF